MKFKHTEETKASTSPKAHPLLLTRLCAYQGVRNVSFSENFAHIMNEWTPNYFYKQLGSGLSPETCLYLKVFGAQSDLRVT